MSLKRFLRYLAPWLMLWATSALAQGGSPTVAQGEEPRPFLLGGIQTHETDHQRWAAALNRSGMNAVQVTVYAHQGPWNSAKLWYEETEQSVLDEIRVARQNGLQVVLILRVALDHNETANRHLWHGLVYPVTERATAEWFRIYSDFVVKWGRIAEEEGVEVLGVASEMNSLAATLPVEDVPGLPAYYLDDGSQQRLRDLVGRSKHLFSEAERVRMGAGDFTSLDDFLVQRNRAERRWARAYIFSQSGDSVASINRRRRQLESHWRQLIRRTRGVYSGRLTLAANFDNYHEVSFWDALDFMGINAYFPLRETLETPLSKEGLAAAWRGIFSDIRDFKATHGLSQGVVFTELGYTRRRGVTVAPWSSKGFIPIWDPEGDFEQDRAFFWSAQPIEPAERALALEALHGVWQGGGTGLSGILYWKLSSVIDLQRFEPFMLYLGEGGDDPSFEALTRFSGNIRPLGPHGVGEHPHLLAVDAVVRGDLDGLKALGGDVLAGPSDGGSPLLHLAVRLGDERLVGHLIDLGADLRQRDGGGALAIHAACHRLDPEWVDRLLPVGEETWRDQRGETPLMKCARLDNESVARRLLAKGHGAIDGTNELGQTALHLAADQGSVPMIELLLAAGGEADALDNHHMTPLHLAARRGAVEIVRALARESKGIANGEGNRPLAEAAIFGRREVFHLLFEPRHVGETNVYGQSLLHLAAHGGDLDILDTLLPYFPDVDPVDLDGWAPLAFAVRNGRVEAAQRLLDRGALVEHRNLEGTSVLQLAGASYEPRLIQQLVQYDIDVDLADGDGNTALHHAAGWGYPENIRLLLEAGAAPDRRNLAGDTPLSLAEGNDRKRAAALLKAALADSPSAN